jgi:DNA polymerase I
LKRLLIDGDQFLFKATAAVEKEIRWDEQNHVLYSNEVEAWGNLMDMLDRIYERFETKNAILCFSSYPIWRTKLSSAYKAGRSRKPLCYAMLRDRLDQDFDFDFAHTVQTFPGLEADDVMGILATKPNAPESIIVSEDKDMKTLPATVWDGQDLVTYTKEEADYWHMFQTLVGDRVDGYPGCPGVGPVKAEKVLKAVHDDTPWHMVHSEFLRAGLTEEDALLNARLARILRWEDWDVEKKEPKLWQPS